MDSRTKYAVLLSAGGVGAAVGCDAEGRETALAGEAAEHRHLFDRDAAVQAAERWRGKGWEPRLAPVSVY